MAFLQMKISLHALQSTVNLLERNQYVPKQSCRVYASPSCRIDLFHLNLCKFFIILICKNFKFFHHLSTPFALLHRTAVITISAI